MKQREEILYTDGHDVMVTYSAIRVKNKWYSINGITRHGLSVLSPTRISSIVLILLGLGLSLTGLFNMAERYAGTSEFVVYNFTIQADLLFFWLGVSFLVLAALILIIVHEQYAISITTAEGERNVIVSPQKEYIMQILKALNTAYLAQKAGKKKSYAVS